MPVDAFFVSEAEQTRVCSLGLIERKFIGDDGARVVVVTPFEAFYAHGEDYEVSEADEQEIPLGSATPTSALPG